MKKVIFLAVMISLLSGTIVAYEWEIEVVDPDMINQYRHYISLALDNFNLPHIAYFIGRPSGGIPPSILRYAFWNGTDWEISMVDDESNSGNFAGETCSLALDSDRRPHISYLATDEDNTYCLKYALWTGAYWDFQVVDYESGRVGEFNSLKLDSLGYPHISYYDYYGDYLKYASWNGETWEIEIVSNGLAWGTSLDLDSLDYPCIAYYGDGNNLNYVHWNGTSWDFYNVDNFGGNVGSIDISLKLDSQDYPHITYYMFNQTLRYARWDGSDWIITTVTGNYGGAYSWLALDNQDFPHIVYYQALGYNWNVWYKYWDGSSWHNEVVNQPLGGGWNCRIALDSQEYPRIAYYNQNNVDLEYASPIIFGIEDDITTSIDNTSVILNNYPNPFNPETTISFNLTAKNAKDAKIEIYNIKGQKIKSFVISQSSLVNGQGSVVWNGTDDDGNDVSSGIYFYCLKSDNIVKVRKAILIK
ncbi:MAG: T9SS type A sorting domain-containing protein [Candidatus Cloacimonetes bacterium]|nr:T9SS type A sorting domain-containing protein [Candidatus Cloacimonadota bacterium]